MRLCLDVAEVGRCTVARCGRHVPSVQHKYIYIYIAYMFCNQRLLFGSSHRSFCSFPHRIFNPHYKILQQYHSESICEGAAVASTILACFVINIESTCVQHRAASAAHVMYTLS